MKERRLGSLDENLLAGKLKELREADRKFREAQARARGKAGAWSFDALDDSDLLYLALGESIDKKERLARHYEMLAKVQENVERRYTRPDGQQGAGDI